jgi:hypothetical protein
MKKFMQLGLLYVVMAIAIVVCGLIFLTMVIAMVGSLLGNLAIWPIIGSALFGYQITLPMAIGIAAIMAVLLFIFAGSIPKRSEEKMGAVMSLGCMGAVLVVVLGFPLWMVLVYFNGGQLTGWAIIPCGIFTAGLIWVWMVSRKPPDDNPNSQRN